MLDFHIINEEVGIFGSKNSGNLGLKKKGSLIAILILCNKYFIERGTTSSLRIDTND